MKPRACIVESAFGGNGDCLHDARFVRPGGLPDRLAGHAVTFAVRPSLVSLFARSFPHLTVVSNLNYEWQGPTVDLPTRDRAGGWAPA
jgi:hypothetical protein